MRCEHAYVPQESSSCHVVSEGSKCGLGESGDLHIGLGYDHGKLVQEPRNMTGDEGASGDNGGDKVCCS